MNLEVNTGVHAALDASHGLPVLVTQLLELDAWNTRRLRHDVHARGRMNAAVLEGARRAYRSEDPEQLRTLHTGLAKLYAIQFDMLESSRLSRDKTNMLADLRGLAEDHMLECECARIDRRLCDQGPRNGDEYVAWLKRLISAHPASNHPFYVDYLRHRAGRDGMRFFLIQETTLDPRFDDILALLQLGTTGNVKMEIASNYWDEMGRGDGAQVHTHLFSQALKALDIDVAEIAGDVTTEALVCGNLSACLSLQRSLFAMSIGYFGVTEYLSPRRFKDFVAGWRRNGLSPEGGVYHEIHIAVDAAHGAGWLKHVISPLVQEHPELAHDITLGTLLRLESSGRYLDALLTKLAS